MGMIFWKKQVPFVSVSFLLHFYTSFLFFFLILLSSSRCVLPYATPVPRPALPAPGISSQIHAQKTGLCFLPLPLRRLNAASGLPPEAWLLKNQKKDRDANSKGTMLLLRVQLIEYHQKWTERRYITRHGLENFMEMYEAYHALGGNGMITQLLKEVKELPIKD